MERRISETDWKYLRQLKPVALDRYCRRVLAEVSQLTADDATSSHDRYLALFELIDERNQELAAAFDNLRRSSAFVQLTRIRLLDLMTDEEFSQFSSETQEVVALFLEAWEA